MPESAAAEIWKTTLILDALGLYTTEMHQKSRESVILRQQQEMMELSTPVVTLWDGHSRASPHRHARQRAHAGRDGEPAAAHRRQRLVDRHPGYHRRPDRRHAGRAAPVEDGGGGAVDGRRLHHQRHPAANRADHRPSRRRPEFGHDQGDARRRIRDGAQAALADRHKGGAVGSGPGPGAAGPRPPTGSFQ